MKARSMREMKGRGFKSASSTMDPENISGGKGFGPDRGLEAPARLDRKNPSRGIKLPKLFDTKRPFPRAP